MFRLQDLPRLTMQVGTDYNPVGSVAIMGGLQVWCDELAVCRPDEHHLGELWRLAQLYR